MGAPRAALLTVAVLTTLLVPSASHNIDGGRSDLPGMKQDMFDQHKKNQRKGGPQKQGKVPECPKSDHMSPFYSLAFANNEMWVRLNGTEGKCSKLITIGGANYTTLQNASRTCGPAGEWKKRIAEELSAMFFQAGLDWVKFENETIEVVTEDGTFEVEVTEAKYEGMFECWKRSCGCEQANNPLARVVFMAMLVIAVGGLGYDSLKHLIDKFRGKKPSKHVSCKKGHKLEEVKHTPRNYCDICGQAGTQYQCSVSCNYDLCKACYKNAKKKLKEELAAWLEKHPDDPDNKKEKKSKKDKGSDKEEKGSDNEEDKSGAEKSDTEQDKKSEKSEEEKSEKSDDKADTEKSETEKDDE